MAEHQIGLFVAQDRFSKQDVADLWVREGALEPTAAQERTSGLLLVAITAEGELAGVCTAPLRRCGRLGMDLWHLGVFVAAAHRGGALEAGLARAGRDELGQRWLSLADRRGGGVRFDPELAGGSSEAVWPELQAVYLGQDEDGRALRVHWFPGAPAPEPWPAVAAAPSG